MTTTPSVKMMKLPGLGLPLPAMNRPHQVGHSSSAMPIGRSKRISRSHGPAGPENILVLSLNSIACLYLASPFPTPPTIAADGLDGGETTPAPTDETRCE